MTMYSLYSIMCGVFFSNGEWQRETPSGKVKRQESASVAEKGIFFGSTVESCRQMRARPAVLARISNLEVARRRISRDKLSNMILKTSTLNDFFE